MTELEFRNKVTWFSFALSLLVIWGHSYNAELFLGYQAAVRKAGLRIHLPAIIRRKNADAAA